MNNQRNAHDTQANLNSTAKMRMLAIAMFFVIAMFLLTSCGGGGGVRVEVNGQQRTPSSLVNEAQANIEQGAQCMGFNAIWNDDCQAWADSQ